MRNWEQQRSVQCPERRRLQVSGLSFRQEMVLEGVLRNWEQQRSVQCPERRRLQGSRSSFRQEMVLEGVLRNWNRGLGMKRRVVVTGMGAVTPIGIGVKEF